MNDLLRLDSCPLCGGDVRTVTAPIDVRIGQRTVSVTAEHEQCSSCQETFFRPGQIDALQRTAAATVRREEGLLQPDEIRSLRERLRLTQAQFEHLIAVGPKTVVRWERGTVFQNSATDTLLRLLAAVPAAVEYLVRIRGVPVKPSLGRHSPMVVPEATAERSYHYTATPVAEPSDSRILVMKEYRPRARVRRKVSLASGASTTVNLAGEPMPQFAIV